MSCEHFFVFGDARTHATCLGSHKTACQKCGKNFFQEVADQVEQQVTAGVYDENTFHIHCWDLDTGKCGSRMHDRTKCKARIP